MGDGPGAGQQQQDTHVYPAGQRSGPPDTGHALLSKAMDVEGEGEDDALTGGPGSVLATPQLQPITRDLLGSLLTASQPQAAGGLHAHPLMYAPALLPVLAEAHGGASHGDHGGGGAGGFGAWAHGGGPGGGAPCRGPGGGGGKMVLGSLPCAHVVDVGGFSSPGGALRLAEFLRSSGVTSEAEAVKLLRQVVSDAAPLYDQAAQLLHHDALPGHALPLCPWDLPLSRPGGPAQHLLDACTTTTTTGTADMLCRLPRESSPADGSAEQSGGTAATCVHLPSSLDAACSPSASLEASLEPSVGDPAATAHVQEWQHAQQEGEAGPLLWRHTRRRSSGMAGRRAPQHQRRGPPGTGA